MSTLYANPAGAKPYMTRLSKQLSTLVVTEFSQLHRCSPIVCGLGSRGFPLYIIWEVLKISAGWQSFPPGGGVSWRCESHLFELCARFAWPFFFRAVFLGWQRRAKSTRRETSGLISSSRVLYRFLIVLKIQNFWQRVQGSVSRRNFRRISASGRRCFFVCMLLRVLEAPTQ